MFFYYKKECEHTKISPDKESGYCPDCGKYIENKWYMARCCCCNIKRKSITKFGEILPETKYCPNCGSEHFYLERVKTINFIDINFAVLIKEVNEELTKNRTQSWLDRENEQPKLLGWHLSFN